MFRDINSAHKRGGMTEELMRKLADNYPEQEIAGAPL
jgi:hypothetical protein